MDSHPEPDSRNFIIHLYDKGYAINKGENAPFHLSYKYVMVFS